jgi:hypothetical protein
MATRYNYTGGIVTNGLVLNLDAAKVDSYPGTGTTWRDLSGNNNNGTLTNGPTFSGIGKQASIVFDGTNDYVDCGNTLANLVNLSLDCWVKFGTQITEYNGLISKTQSNSNGYELRTLDYTPTTTNVQFRYVGDIAATSGYNATNGIWYNISATGESGAQKLYINGTLYTANTVAATPSPHGFNLLVGKLAYFSTYLLGNIASAKIYNRALTAQEVSQNFNALRGRYGI